MNTGGRAEEARAVPGAAPGKLDIQRLRGLWSLRQSVAFITAGHLAAALFWSRSIGRRWEDCRPAFQLFPKPTRLQASETLTDPETIDR